jgi:hypothetical protein
VAHLHGRTVKEDKITVLRMLTRLKPCWFIKSEVGFMATIDLC